MTRSRTLVVCGGVIIGLVLSSGIARDIRADGIAGFHHVHLNAVDPERSIAFYTRSFPQTRRTQVAGWPALRSENAFLLFNRVETAASAAWDTAIWHFGWHSADTVADHRRLAADGVPFFRVPPPSGHMYGPDGNDVEIAPRGSGTGGGPGPTAFNHVHLMSAAPLCAADWYEEILGLTRLGPRTPAPPDCHVPFGPRRDPGNQIHEPNVRLPMGEIVLSIYPNQQPAATLVSPIGHVLDHIALVYPDLPAAVPEFRRKGVRILRDLHRFGDTQAQAIFIEGPDAIAIELIDRAGT